MPSNRLLAAIRTRRGLKWGLPAMLVALPYFLIAYACSSAVADGGPGWPHLIVLWACWNALKFIIMGPVSVVLLSAYACTRPRSVVASAARPPLREIPASRYCTPELADCDQGRRHPRPTPTARPDNDAVRCESPPDSLRPCPNLHADLYQRQPAEIEVGCFLDAGRVETPASDRNLPTNQVGGNRTAVHAEPRCQLHERRPIPILRRQIVDLLGAQKGLSHPK